MKNLKLRIISVLLILTLGFTLIYPVSALESQPSILRIFGKTRYETALSISDALWETSNSGLFDSVVVANGQNFPDALSGAYLSVRLKAPILLSNNKNLADLQEYIKQHLKTNGTIYILGGTKAISSQTENKLGSAGNFNIKRLGGIDRYETNLMILRETGINSDSVLICTGKNYADNICATATGLPILLVSGNELTSEQQDIVNFVEKVYIIGGKDAVSEKIEADVSKVKEVTRIGGKNRYETSALIADYFFNSPTNALLACGKNFPDGLCAGSLASLHNSPVLLISDGNNVFAREYVLKNKIASGFVFGGPGIISDKTVCEVFSIPENSIIPNWYPTQYTIDYYTDGGVNSSQNPDSYTFGSSVVFFEPTKEGYSFEGWFADQEMQTQITGVLPGTGKNLTLYAKWKPLDNPLAKPNPENVAAVLDYAARLYGENTMENYVNGVFTWDKPRNSNWIYFTGLMFDSFLSVDFEKYSPEITKFYNQHVNSEGKIPKYLHGELDAALPGVAMIELLNGGCLSKEETILYQKGINYIYNQLENQTMYPQAGNLWLHSQTSNGTPRPAWVKWNICLDGVYMSQLFLLRLTEAIDAGNITITDNNGSVVTSEQIWNDIYSRLTFVMDNMKNPENGLLYHGYCVETGETNLASWSRGIGWYSMVLIEAAEKMPDETRRSVLVSDFTDLMDSLLLYQDQATSLWYNVTDGREEYVYVKQTEQGDIPIYNMPESSGSAMFAYCLLRGYHNGILKDECYREAGLRAFNSLVETRLTDEGLTDIYTSSSVTANKNLYQRNGYTTNDGKGVAPFILAAKYAH